MGLLFSEMAPPWVHAYFKNSPLRRHYLIRRAPRLPVGVDLKGGGGGGGVVGGF